MFKKLVVLENFVKIIGKRLCRSLVCHEVAGRKNFQNLQENTSAEVSLLIKLQAEKIHKIYRKVPVPKSRF